MVLLLYILFFTIIGLMVIFFLAFLMLVRRIHQKTDVLQKTIQKQERVLASLNKRLNTLEKSQKKEYQPLKNYNLPEIFWPEDN